MYLIHFFIYLSLNVFLSFFTNFPFIFCLSIRCVCISFSVCLASIFYPNYYVSVCLSVSLCLSLSLSHFDGWMWVACGHKVMRFKQVPEIQFLIFSDSICTLIFHTSTNHLSPPTKMLILLTSTIPLVLPPSWILAISHTNLFSVRLLVKKLNIFSYKILYLFLNLWNI